MKLLAVDGNSILNRAYYGIKALTTKNGEFTNGIYGFLSILRSLLDELKPDAVACAFDLRAPTFRHLMYDGYKGQRKGMPDELAGQLEPLKELLRALGFRIVTCEGYEADDILGTLAESCTQAGAQCVIATGDRDSLQLVNELVTVRLATTKMGRPEAVLYDIAAVAEKYGVTPAQLIDVKALMGDASDNIPGVAGVGEKTALDLITRFHDLDAIYRDLDTLDIKPGVRTKLQANKDMAYTSRALAEIYRQTPVETDPELYRPAPIDQPAAAALFARLEMFGLQKKWGIDPSAAAQSATLSTAPVVLAPPLSVVSEPLRAAALAGSAVSADLLIEWGDEDYPQALAAILPTNQLLLGGEELLTLLLSGGARLRLWNSKPLYRYLYKNNKEIQLVEFDGELAAYLLSPASSAYQPNELAAQYGIPARRLEGAPEMAGAYEPLLTDAALMRDLLDALAGEVGEKEQEKLLFEIEMPLARVLAVMECEGFALDTAALTAYGVELDGRLARLQANIFELSGCEFNLNSPRQMGEVLFERLGLPAKKKTKTGYSTNAEVLDGLRGKHPVIESILEYRQLSKLKSTYVDGLLAVAGADGRVRSTFRQTETRTGRISSTEPNLQNIPVRTPEGGRMRAFFGAREGWRLIDADYSQIELRVLAHIAQDKGMLDAFRDGEDIHTNTAAQVFHLPPLMVTPAMRSRAKAVNFGIVYGIGAFSLAQDIGVSVAEARAYIDEYLATFKGVKIYMDETIAFARQNGFVKTMFGRRRYLPELAASNKLTQAFGERVAMNTPIQGTAADIIKIAMVRVYARLRAEGLQARLILQVHDELLVEAPESEVAIASIILQEEMEQAVKLKIPLVAETHAGINWLEAK